MHVDEAGRNNEALAIDFGDFGLRIANCGLIGDPAIHDHEITDFIAVICRIDDAAVADDGCFHCTIRVAHASRVLVSASRRNSLPGKVRESVTLPPARETRALPR